MRPFSDSFTMQHTSTVPANGFVPPVVTGNGDHANMQIIPGATPQQFIACNIAGEAIGSIEFTSISSDVVIHPYASKDGQYMVATAAHNGQEFRLLVGAGGTIDINGAKASMAADELMAIAPLLPETAALYAANLNERANHTQDIVKTMYIPASGKGTRLEPILENLNDETKPNTYLYGQTTILRQLIEHYKHFGIEKFIVGVLDDRKAYFKKNLADLGDTVQLIGEKQQSGTAGPLARILAGETPGVTLDPGEPILVGMGDAVLKSTFDVADFIEKHNAVGADATLAVAKVPEHLIHKYGMVKTETPNASSWITGFTEKPKTDEAKAALGEHRLANTAIYVLGPKALESLKSKYAQVKSGKLDSVDNGVDFARHIFEPGLDDGLKLYANTLDFDKWVDIGHLNTMNVVHRRIANGDIYGAQQTKQARDQVGDGGAIFYGGKATKEAFNKAFPDAKVGGNVVVVQAK